MAIPASSLWRSRPAKLLGLLALLLLAVGIGIPATIVYVVISQERPDGGWAILGSLLPSLVLLPLGVHFLKSAGRAAYSRTEIEFQLHRVHVTRTNARSPACLLEPANFLGTMIGFQLHPAVCWELIVVLGSATDLPFHFVQHDRKQRYFPDEITAKLVQAEELFQVANARSMEELAWIAEQVHAAMASIPRDDGGG